MLSSSSCFFVLFVARWGPGFRSCRERVVGLLIFLAWSHLRVRLVMNFNMVPLQDGSCKVYVL